MKDAICSQEKCTLCMACVNICPQNAIFLDYDAYGYEKIVIDQEKCISCGLCEGVCTERNHVTQNVPIQCYAAQIKAEKDLFRSASGGAFQALAHAVLEAGGICYGCMMELTDGVYRAKHIRVDALQDLPQILNSKYIPSIVGTALQKVKDDLETGKQVLFSGTPCQIKGLKAFLKKDYDNLLTADLICHGVTATKLFNDYIKCQERRENITIESYCFRDKSISWGTNFTYSYVNRANKNSRIKEKHCPREASSYMMHYLRGNIFRENCYACELACVERVGDFTLGDYWEIEREHPEFVLGKAPRMSLRGGISCILVNTKKAMEFVPRLEQRMIMRPVSLDSVRAHNGNLRASSTKGSKRDWLLQTYKTNGYVPIDEEYRKTVGRKMMIYKIKNLLKSRLPDCVRIWIYRSAVLRRVVFHK